MGTFLDAQTSQNASFSDSISIPVTTTPALFGSLGLNTANCYLIKRSRFQPACAR